MPIPTGWLGKLTGVFGQSATTSTFVGNIGDTFPDDIVSREKLASVVRAIKLISEDIARLTVRTQRDDPDDPVQVSHKAIDLLQHQANPYQTGREWRAWMVSTSILRGSSYSYVERAANGEAVNLWPLLPGRVTAVWGGFFLAPKWLLDGREIDPHEIIVLMSGPGNHNNPYLCDSPLTKCAPALTLAVVQERCALALAAAGRMGKVSITHPGTLSTAAKLDLLDTFTRKHISPEGAARPLVLDEGVKVERLSDGNTGSLTEDRRFSIMEVARALSIPPQMLFQGDAGSLNSQIEMMRQYVETAVQPWCVKFADAMRTKLLPSGLRFAFDHHALMRGNLRDTASALKDLSSTGAVTVNDAREMLGLPEDLTGGDQPIQPSVVARE
jgi:HK97 family phage portal protein